MGGLELSTMKFVQAFGTLKILCIVKQVKPFIFLNLAYRFLLQDKVKCIDGLQFCNQLESLWISECCVRQISGLESCSRLVNLHLSSNSICRMEGVSQLSTLQVVYLCYIC